MKLLLTLLGLVLACTAQAQQTITSVNNGNANNPLVWDCLCFPTPNDEIIIAHDIVMNVDWIIATGGSITVNSGASLIQDANYRAIAVDGTGSAYTNNGTTELTNMTFTANATGTNNGTMKLDTALYTGNTGAFTNTGTLSQLDSVLNLGSFSNSGTLLCGDFWSTGTFLNTGHIDADSIGVDGTTNFSAGLVECLAFGNIGSVSVFGNAVVMVDIDFWNTGDFNLAPTRTVHIGNNFYNGDSTGATSPADLINDGVFEVANDFYNSDNLSGSGTFCIGEYSASAGTVSGTLDICDNTGIGFFDVNVGSIGPNVTDCITGCTVGVEEAAFVEFTLYPNPATNVLNLEVESNANYSIFAVNGQLMQNGIVQTGRVELNDLPAGLYTIVVDEASARFIKQ